MSSKTLKQTAQLLLNKAGLKQDVYQSAMQFFTTLSQSAIAVSEQLSPLTTGKDQRVRMAFIAKSDHEFHLKVGSDILIFILHTNVFQLDPEHPCWNQDYFKDKPQESYFGIVNVYNFLHDSIHYNRIADVGYLITRIFVNRRGHFFTETRSEDELACSLIQQSELKDNQGQDLICQLIQFVTGFDLFVPPFQSVAEISVDEMNAEAQNHKLKTAKRLGFNYGSSDV